MSHPAQVVADAVNALNREDWDSFVAVCDSVSLRRFKRDLVWQFTDRGPGDISHLDDFLGENRDRPWESADDILGDIERRRSPLERLRLEIRTVSSIEELTALEPGQVLVRWLQARTLRGNEFSASQWQPTEGFDLAECRSQYDDELSSGMLPRPEYVVLGSVRDGPDFAQVICSHVLEFEDDSDDADIPEDEFELERALRRRKWMYTAACRKQSDGSWRLIADRSLFFMANMSIADPDIY